MLEILPNIREATLIGSGLFLIVAIAVVAFTAYSRRVQNDQYRFVEGQWFGLVAIFVFGLVFSFGWALPKPGDQPIPVEQRRAEAFQNYYSACHNTTEDRVDCTILARQQADVSLGIAPVIVKTVWVNRDLLAQTRADRYDLYFRQCKADLPYALPDSRSYSARQLNYCRSFAAEQIRTSLQ